MESNNGNTTLLLSDSQTIKARRIFEILDNYEMENPTIEGDPIDCLKSEEYKFKFLLINIDYNNFEKIIQEAKNHFADIGIIVIWDSKKIEEAQAKEIAEKMGIKHLVERASLSIKNFGTIVKQIQEEHGKIAAETPKKADRYTFVKNLGIGASAQVFLYKDNEKDRLVAVKKISLEGMEDSGKTRVKKEVEYMQSVQSPTIISFYESTVENNVRYLYMEYASKGTLEEKIIDVKWKGKDFPNEQILDWIIEVLLSLYILNKKGMMHRDIKSENLLITENDVIKLADLGISKMSVGDENHTLVGTPYYVSPELTSIKSYGPNTDIWSLGVVLYELIVGKKPFHKEDTADLYESIKVDEYPSLPQNTDPILSGLIEIMLRKNPKKRPSAEEILQYDVINDRLFTLIERYKWTSEMPFYQELKNMKKVSFPHSIKLLSDENTKLLKNAYKIYDVVPSTPYKKSMFSLNSMQYTKTGADLLTTAVDEVIQTEEHKNDPEEEAEKLLNELIDKEVLIPVDSKNREIDEKAVYYFSFDKFFEVNYDNADLITKETLNQSIDLHSLSQVVLSEGLHVIEKVLASESKTEIITSLPYIKLMTGISYFSSYNIGSLSQDEKLATLLNVYQVMFIHHICNVYLENNLKENKGGLLNFFKSTKKTTITYQFKDMSLNNMDIKHVVFRNNKAPSGGYRQLANAGDQKTMILPSYTDLRPLFILYDLDDENLLDMKYRFQVFEAKDIQGQLDEAIVQFIVSYVQETDESIVMPQFIKRWLNDFGSPGDMVKFLAGIYTENKAKPVIMQAKTSEEQLEFVNNISSVVRKLKNGSMWLSYE